MSCGRGFGGLSEVAHSARHRAYQASQEPLRRAVLSRSPWPATAGRPASRFARPCSLFVGDLPIGESFGQFDDSREHGSFDTRPRDSQHRIGSPSRVKRELAHRMRVAGLSHASHPFGHLCAPPPPTSEFVCRR